MTTTTSTTITMEKRRRYPISDSDDDHGEILNGSPQLTSKRRVSATADMSAHRLIVSERRQLAVLKRLTATDKTKNISSSRTSQARPTKIFRRNEHGETIVHIAARKGDLKRLKKALKEGANVNEEDNAGWTPLHEAVTKNQFKAANLLLKSGANANAPGPEGQTPLIDAVFNNNIKIAGLLLTYSADSSGVDVTRLNETMVKVLKGEITTFDLSENDNDDEESLSPTSPTISADEFEQDEKNLSKHFHEHSSDSSINNKSSFITDNETSRKNPYDFESDDEYQGIIEDESTIDTDRSNPVPPLRIVVSRTALENSESTTSLNNMDESLTMECSSLPIIEENEKLLSTMTTSTEFNEKIADEEAEQSSSSGNKNNPMLSNSDSEQSQSPETIISTLMDNLLSQIEAHGNAPLEFPEGQVIRITINRQGDSKQTTRTLRSHARGKTLPNINDHRRVSNRRRIFEKKFSLDTHEKPRRKKTISEQSTNSNNNHETSSNSDDPTMENNPTKMFTLKSSIIDRISADEDPPSDEDSHSPITTKQTPTHSDINSLPPNKRRLRERNAGLLSATEENNSTTRDMPTNGIKQFLEIRHQIEKRHQAMLNEFVLPKVPKDFGETLMATKNYLLAPLHKSLSITTPASLGIKRLNPPADLDFHLSDVFTRQEDERYRMKLRHQVEREKLILSHEQEVLRLYGNAARSSSNQEIPFSYCSLLKDNEVYNNPTNQERPSSLINNDYPNTELGKRGKHRWNGRALIKWVEDSNLKYKRLSCEINQRQHLEANTLFSMQRMVWLKHIPKETSSSTRMNSYLSERYLPKVEINTNFWTHWEANSI